MEMKQIKDFEDYFITDDGRVYSNKTKKYLKYNINKGYRCVTLLNNGKRKLAFIHRLVADYYIPNPENKPTVNHINHIRTDNRLENLEWATYPEQNDEIWKERQSEAHKGQHSSPETEFKPTTVYQYTLDGKLVKIWLGGGAEAERVGGYSKECISRVCLGKQEKHRKFKWSYKKMGDYSPNKEIESAIS